MLGAPNGSLANYVYSNQRRAYNDEDPSVPADPQDMYPHLYEATVLRGSIAPYFESWTPIFYLLLVSFLPLQCIRDWDPPDLIRNKPISSTKFQAVKSAEAP